MYYVLYVTVFETGNIKKHIAQIRLDSIAQSESRRGVCGILLSCCVVVAVCADENFFISKKIKGKTKIRKIGKFQPTHNKKQHKFTVFIQWKLLSTQ